VRITGSWSIASLVLAFVAFATPVIRAEDDLLMRSTVQVELGQDRGQSLGSLFEAAAGDGSLVVGAGFCDVFNTHLRMDRHVLQFFVRLAGDQQPYELEPLPRPSSASGTYLFSLRDRVIAVPGSGATEARVLDEAANSWRDGEGATWDRVMLAGAELAMGDSRFYYDGNLILDAPEEGSYQRFYYANGHLFFYHVNRGEESVYRPWESDENGFSKLYACPWDPADGGGVDLSQALVLTLSIVGETTFSWGQSEGLVMTGSNIGGLYAFDGDEWRIVREPSLGASFQVYTMVQYYDRLLLGQYPTGEFFAFEGDRLERLEGWPPRLDGVSPSARECQTAMVWGGELIAGVWPWGELWRHDGVSDEWETMGRLFTHPDVHEAPIHPYQAEAEERGDVLNQWGQRITSMVPFGDSLLISTATKWPFEPEPAPEFMTSEQLDEYGRVWRLRVPGCVSAPIDWTAGATEFEFVVTATELQIWQDGRELVSTPLPNDLATQIAQSKAPREVQWGAGAYGPFGGVAVRGAIEPQLQSHTE